MFPHVTCFCKGTEPTSGHHHPTKTLAAACDRLVVTTDNMKLGHRAGKATWIVTLPGEMRSFERRASRQLLAALERFEVSELN